MNLADMETFGGVTEEDGVVDCEVNWNVPDSSRCGE